MKIDTTWMRSLTWKPKQGPRVVVPDNRNAPRPEKVDGFVLYPHDWFENRTLPHLEASLIRLVATRSLTMNGLMWFRAYAHPIVDAVDAKGHPIRIPDAEALIGVTLGSLDDLEFCDLDDREAITTALTDERTS